MCTDAASPQVHGADEQADLIRGEVYSFPHVAGTCSMGPLPDAGAVVDAAGHVYGAEQLTVIDASVVPNGPSAFTHIPTLMLAERLCEKLVDRV